MHTSITGSNVKIIDPEGLKSFLDRMKRGLYRQYIVKEPGWSDTGENRGLIYANAVAIEGDMLNFGGFDGWKIISYYHKYFVQFIRDLAVFVQGDVDMKFENDDEAGWIEFSDGKAIFHCGVTRWQIYKPEELRPEIEPMPQDVKARLVARKI